MGVHGESVDLPIQGLWIKDVAITTGLVPATTTPMLLKPEDMMEAYGVFERAAQGLPPHPRKGGAAQLYVVRI